MLHVLIFPALKICGSDTKALFRRVQSLEKLGKLGTAYADARRLYQIEPNNKAVQEICFRLRNVLELKVSCLFMCPVEVLLTVIIIVYRKNFLLLSST